MVAPLLWTLLLSLKHNADLVGHSGAALHPPYTLDNYGAIFGNSLTLRWLLNSAIVALGQTAGVLILASLAGYAFARLEFPFRRTLFVIVLLGLAVPSQAVILPQHQLFAWLHLHNSYPGLILPGLVAPFGVFFMTTYMRGIPRRAGRGGDARRRIALDDLLEDHRAADAAGAVDAGGVHLPRRVERLLVAADQRDAERHVHADGRPRGGADELCADQRPWLSDGAGGVRVDPDLHRLHRLPEADRARDGRRGGAMKRLARALLVVLALGSCAKPDHRTHIYLQRFFGECGAEYGGSIDVAKAEGECGIITTLINRFNAENPDIHIDVNVVAWPGYPQLTAQVAARDPPDLVTMHEGVISDYALKGLLEPVDDYLKMGGVDTNDFTDAARAGVTINGHAYGLPWDTHGGLFHVNTALIRQGGTDARRQAGAADHGG